MSAAALHLAYKNWAERAANIVGPRLPDETSLTNVRTDHTVTGSDVRRLSKYTTMVPI